MERAGVLLQVVERGVQAAGLGWCEWPGADGVLLAAEVAFVGFAVFQQTFDDGDGKPGAGRSLFVGELLYLRGALGIELQVGVREGFRFGFVANRWARGCRMIYGGHDQLFVSWLWLSRSWELALPRSAPSIHGCMGHRRCPVRDGVDDETTLAQARTHTSVGFY